MAEGEPTRVIASNIADNAPYTKTRTDERFVSTRQENLVLDSSAEYIVLDEMESGELQSVRIVVDNPYVQVLLQLDDYRNKDPDGESAAEIIYNGNSDTANRGFKVLDGQGSGKGYVMEYRPDVPESYKGRIRLVIRNQIKPNDSVYGMDLSYTSRGSLANPAVPAHMAGGTFSHPALRSAKLDQISQVMTKPVGVEGYSSNQVFNEAIIYSDNPVGSDHPYQGMAGKPFFLRDDSSIFVSEGARTTASGTHDVIAADGNAMRYGLKVIDEPEYFPGTSSIPSTMKIRIAPLYALTHDGAAFYNENDGFAMVPWHTISTVDRATLMSKGPFNDTWPGTSTYTAFPGGTALDGTALPAAESMIGKRFFFRRGGTVYFPGVIKSITKKHADFTATESNNYWDNTDGYVAYDFNGSTVKKGVGVYPASDFTGITTKVQIVMAPIPETSAQALNGVIVGSAPTIVPLECTGTGDGLNSAFTYSGYDVSEVPHCPWVYEIEFEPGVTNTPIDFPVTLPADQSYPANPGVTAYPANNVSTGVFAGTYLAGDGLTSVAKKGLLEASDSNCWGTVTSQADTNPHALIKEIEVKRAKKVSFDG
jgi:hypothetical protein